MCLPNNNVQIEKMKYEKYFFDVMCGQIYMHACMHAPTRVCVRIYIYNYSHK